MTFAKNMNKNAKVTRKVTSVQTPVTKSSYEGATLFTLPPLRRLAIVAASCLLGEPPFYESANKRVAHIEQYIDEALSDDFKGTLDLAVALRREQYMKLIPQVIFVRAAMHPDRVTFTEQHAGYFTHVEKLLALTPYDITNQVAYYISKNNGNKRDMPGILKRAAATRLAEFNPYQIAKHAGKGMGLINVVRIVHANSDPIDKLMRGEAVVTENEDRTWLNLRSDGYSWDQIIKSGVKLTHSDMLLQLRNICDSLSNADLVPLMRKFVEGVPFGKLFPYQYWVAYKQLSNDEFFHKDTALRVLEQCLEASVAVQPKIGGRVACIADNSGSMDSKLKTFGFEVSFADVANLSCVLMARNSVKGDLFSFGDNCKQLRYSKDTSIMQLAHDLSKLRTGHGTEMDSFWKLAIDEHLVYDTVVIFSDMQTKPGYLSHGIVPDVSEFSWTDNEHRAVVTMHQVVNEYRRLVNPRVNVFYNQVAGYDATVEPDNGYRTTNIAGWTSSIAAYIHEINRQWDEIEGIV